MDDGWPHNSGVRGIADSLTRVQKHPSQGKRQDSGESKSSAMQTTSALFRPRFAKPNAFGLALYILVLAGAAAYTGYALTKDIEVSGDPLAIGVLIVLGFALVLALGFEFVNGFHDTANAVATVIYTRSLPPTVAVIWSGVWNFLGVLASTGAVAYSIIMLLPVELLLQVGSNAGYAMIFALLSAAIIWNVGTWFIGIPNSSSHALIGSVLGVGLANQLMAPEGFATSGVDWSQAEKIGKALLFSPMVGFIAAAMLLLLLKALARNPKINQAPSSDEAPPWWIKGTLIATCTAVSFAHGGNDGQKGMGLIMLILIGAAPAAFALNRALPEADVPAVVRAFEDASAAFTATAEPAAATDVATARTTIGDALRTKTADSPETSAALAALSADVAARIETYGSFTRVPTEDAAQLRSDMYTISEAAGVRLKSTGAAPSPEASAAFKNLQTQTKASTRYIPNWVKIAVAFALGLGTMAGWKRIVITVGERIGKKHMTYAQGASAEFMAATTILTAQHFGLPVSTTHVLSSGVAGTMAANGSGLQWRTIGAIASAWLLTFPAVVALSGGFYWLFMLLVS